MFLGKDQFADEDSEDDQKGGGLIAFGEDNEEIDVDQYEDKAQEDSAPNRF